MFLVIHVLVPVSGSNRSNIDLEILSFLTEAQQSQLFTRYQWVYLPVFETSRPHLLNRLLPRHSRLDFTVSALNTLHKWCPDVDERDSRTVLGQQWFDCLGH